MNFKQPAELASVASRRSFASSLGFIRSLPQSFMDKVKKTKDVATTTVAGTPAATIAAPSSPDAKKKPVATIRLEDCSASIWGREYVAQGQPRVFYSVTFERSYKDRNGAWKYAHSFDAESLGKVVSLCQQASETIHNLMQ